MASVAISTVTAPGDYAVCKDGAFAGTIVRGEFAAELTLTNGRMEKFVYAFPSDARKQRVLVTKDGRVFRDYYAKEI